MFLKNTAARLITINTPGVGEGQGASYNLVPGASVEIKGDLGNAQGFVDYLIESGQLVEVASAKAEVKAETKAK